MGYVLIIDDDDDFTAAVATVLGNGGHEVQIEPDVDNAIKNMEARQPDLVVLDVMFPEDPAAGFSLARQMRQEGGALKSVPILMLTAVNTKFPLGFDSGDIDDDWLPVTDFLEKPVDLDVLQSKVDALLLETKKPTD